MLHRQLAAGRQAIAVEAETHHKVVIMNKVSLDTAIHLGQLIKLLAPLGNASKSVDKRLGRLRSGVHEQIILAVAGPDIEAAGRAQRSLDELSTALLGAMVRHLDVQDLLARSHSTREVALLQVIKGVRRNDCESTLFADVEAVRQEPVPEEPIAQAERARILRAYTSAVKNSSWLPTLLRLKLALRLANSENEYLVKEHSSTQGNDALPATLRSLCPDYDKADSAPVGARPGRSKKAPAAAGLYTLQVAFQAEALLARPDIAALANVTFKGAEPAPTLGHLLEHATKPVIVSEGDAPDVVAQRILDELVTALVARKTAADAEKATLRQKADEAARNSAVEALKQLSPSLLKTLRSNPELLNAV